VALPEEVVDDTPPTKRVADKLIQIILDRIASDRLVLPAMPQVALRCLELLHDEKRDFSAVSAAVSRDPLLAPKIVRAANSAAFIGRDHVTSLEQAISRLGIQRMNTLLVEFSARTVFASRDARIRDSF